jgi:hypothetical protein
MAHNRSITQNALYSVTRLAPIIAPLLIIPAIPPEAPLADLMIKRLLILTTLAIAWNMAEGAMILWMRAKTTASDREKSYLVVTMLLGAVVLGLLQFFRAFVSQEVFILALATLSARGTARSGWDNARPAIGFLGALSGNALLTLLSFILVTPSLDWQSALCALAIGSSVASVEAQWNSDRFPTVYDAQWPARSFRLSVLFGPVVIATLSMAHQLQWHYFTTLVVVVAARSLLRESVDKKEIPPYSLRGAHALSLLFFLILGACRAYQAGAFR